MNFIWPILIGQISSGISLFLLSIVGFFTAGREYENAYINHKYTETERKELLK